MHEKFCCNYNCLIMQEVTFEEYLNACHIKSMYEFQMGINQKTTEEIESLRIKMIMYQVEKYVEVFKCAKGEGRPDKVVFYRHALSHWLKHNTGFSFKYIGKVFLKGFDHSTVCNHLKSHENQRKLKPHRRNIHHVDAMVQIKKYFGHLTKATFGKVEPLPIEQEGSFFISNN